MGIELDINTCTGCEACVGVCRVGVITMVEGKAQIGEGCILCGACVDACPVSAIAISGRGEVPEAEGEYRGVWVVAEQRRGHIRGVAYELLNRGQELAKSLGTELSAVCLGHQVDGIDELTRHGAAKVYVLDDASLAENLDDVYAHHLAALVRKYKPEVVLAGATAFGRTLMPRLAALLETGLTADCTGLAVDQDKRFLLQTRPTFGGNLMATIICPARRPQMATVRPHVFSQGTADQKAPGQIVRVDVKSEAITSRAKLLGFVEDLSRTVNLDDAQVIVSGGRGLGKPDNFGLIEELASVLGAAVGSSRPPVDEGWIAYPHQVGQTGKTVSPNLYIACGISGSVQHLAGMQTAKCIVAINQDPQAPIFQVATYGIVGDLFKVVPMLVTKLKEKRGN